MEQGRARYQGILAEALADLSDEDFDCLRDATETLGLLAEALRGRGGSVTAGPVA